MTRRLFASVPVWSIAVPVLACIMLAAIWGLAPGWFLSAIAGSTLIASVLVAVHHAEVIAHRLGEPFGTLVLALAVTVIEVSLIVSMMRAGGEGSSALARDTVYATVMIVCNGVIGLCLLMGSIRHRTIGFRVEGTTPALAVLATLTTLTLVLPTYTSSTAGPTFSAPQLVFAGVVSFVLWGVFVFVQTVRHRDYFLPANGHSEDAHAAPPSGATALISLVLLLVSLVAVVGLAKVLAPSIEAAVVGAGMPHAVVGIAIALMVLLPETMSAVRAARSDRMQTSFNLALGSALATIGLTIPAVAATSILLGLPLDLGLPPKEVALLALTLLLTSTTLSGGRATILQGAVHLVVFAVFVFLAMVP
ncbi:MAG: ionic transporter y4hA [Candidatus Accumulibacter sp.]|jgi:Ca2+:H+ antiporter|uniref:calcium:proton antiporter n=1 Tax=Accumulibacter sp. TaxID=2053492 RepID=UPI001AD2BA6F|nr:ionic transporter y4hA [Accumulibacter sp.]MBK8579906.1 ionic transporter y4hA [Candidatus Accumulibacter propinquus]MBN8439806.1 ionic transporter y4hA [Accumulibacter sp.]